MISEVSVYVVQLGGGGRERGRRSGEHGACRTAAAVLAQHGTLGTAWLLSTRCDPVALGVELLVAVAGCAGQPDAFVRTVFMKRHVSDEKLERVSNLH